MTDTMPDDDELVAIFKQLTDALVRQPAIKDIGDAPRQEGFVYLAGPYRGSAIARDWTAYCDLDANINEARRWALEFAGDSIPFFCPHLHNAHMEVIAPHVLPEFWLRMDIEILSHAEVIFMLPNWRKSKGALAELAYAQEVGMPIYTHNMYDMFVEDWRKKKVGAVGDHGLYQIGNEELPVEDKEEG